MNYSEIIWRHFMAPKHAGELPAGPDVRQTQIGTAATGDIIQLTLQIDADQCIKAIKFKAHGSGVLIAVTDYVVDLLLGQPLESVKQLNQTLINQALALPRAKLHYISLVLDALQTQPEMSYE